VPKSGIKFIGPSDVVIEKWVTSPPPAQTAVEAGVPVIPGTHGIVANVTDALKAANEIGYPVMIKASSGGGGRGMRIALNHEDLPGAFQTARAEAMACFGDDRVYLERLSKIHATSRSSFWLTSMAM